MLISKYNIIYGFKLPLISVAELEGDEKTAVKIVDGGDNEQNDSYYLREFNIGKLLS